MYRMIITDIQMPEKDGFETAQEIRSLFKSKKIGSDVIIVANSAYLPESEKAKGILYGIDYFVNKSFSQSEF